MNIKVAANEIRTMLEAHGYKPEVEVNQHGTSLELFCYHTNRELLASLTVRHGKFLVSTTGTTLEGEEAVAYSQQLITAAELAISLNSIVAGIEK